MTNGTAKVGREADGDAPGLLADAGSTPAGPAPKERVLYADFRWLSAFERIKEGQQVTARGVSYKVDWKHIDPPWVRLRYLGRRTEYLMVRKGDPMLLELA